MRRPSSLNKKYLLYLFFLLAALAPYIYLSFFAHPVADDLAGAYQVRNTPAKEVLEHCYLNWGGRYIPHLLMFLNPIVYNSLLCYKLIPVLLFILTGCSFYLFISSFLKNITRSLHILAFSVLFLLLYIHQMPNIAEGFYWYAGSSTYQTANIFCLIYFSFLINYLKREYFLSKLIHQTFFIFVLFICLGFNEVTTGTLVLFNLFLSFIAYKYFKPNKAKLIFFVLLNFCFAGIMIFSPGNEARSLYFSENHRFIRSLVFSSLQTLRFSMEWISSIPLLIASILYLNLHSKLSEKYLLFKRSFFLSPLSSTLILFLPVFISVFIPYWAMGMLGQHRTVNCGYFFFLIFWFINLSVWLNYFNYSKQTISLNNFNLLIILLFGVGLIFTKNGYNACYDIFYGRAKSFNEQMNRRYSLIQEGKNSDSQIIILPGIDNPPKTLFVLDIEKDPNSWINNCYVLYYELGNKKIIKE